MAVKKRLLISAALAAAIMGCKDSSEPSTDPNVVAKKDPPAVATPEVPAVTNPEPPATDPKTPAPGTKPAPAPLDPAKLPENSFMRVQIEGRNKPTYPVKIPNRASQGWSDAGMGASELASKVSKAVAGLSGAMLDAKALVSTPLGKGHYMSTAKLQDRKTYNVRYFHIGDVPISGNLVANGKERIVRVDMTWSNAMAAGQPLPNTRKAMMNTMRDKPDSEKMAPITDSAPASVVENWPREFSRLMFQGYTEGKDAISPAVEGWAKGMDGYKLKPVEKMSQIRNGKPFTAYRIIAYKIDPDAKKPNSSVMEFVVDGKQFLPITVRSVWKDEQGKDFSVMWAARWKFKQKFPATEFDGPYTAPKKT